MRNNSTVQRISIICLLTIFSTSAAWAQFTRDCDRYPVLYKDSDFRGQALRLDRSESDLHNRGFGDEASSICVPSGWRVIIYEDDNFRGDRLEIRGPNSIGDLKRQRPQGRDWGDRISSVEIFEERPSYNTPADCNRYPILFEDRNFRGRQVRLDRDIRDIHSLGLGDEASSVCIPSGWIVELYEDKDFRGDRLTLRGGVIADLKRERPQGSDWGDRISSVRVSQRRGERDRYDPYPDRRPGRIDRGQDGGQTDDRFCDRYPVLFSNDNFRGRNLEVRSSIRDLRSFRFSEQTSSVCVPYGWRLVLYDESDFQGRRLELRSGEQISHLSNQGWSNRVRSVRVEADNRR